MNEGWYDTVEADEPITQGDIVFDCPLIGWQSDNLNLEYQDYLEALKTATIATQADVVVLTQACDLEHHKIENVILCSHLPIGEYQSIWEDEMRSSNQNPTAKAWKSHCDDICDGFVWNMAMLNSLKTNEHKMKIRVVDFREIFTVPLTFLESLLSQRNAKRIRLLPPYREHLSQAFARFFMRVGLPNEVEKTW